MPRQIDKLTGSGVGDGRATPDLHLTNSPAAKADTHVSTTWRFFVWSGTAISILLCSQLTATAQLDDQTQRQGIAYFEQHIRPVLVESCSKCHSATSKILRGGLRLDGPQDWLQGGDSGPAIVPRDVDASLLIDALEYNGLEMPPEGKLRPQVIERFRQWIRMGAPAPAAKSTPQTHTAGPTADHWSFQEIRRQPLPEVRRTAWPISPIDHWILHQLEQTDLRPAGDASQVTLARRLYFDLIGVPPTEPELKRFLNDNRPDAYRRLVDRLLSDPRFGERWGRHWLDVVRFAESSGGGRTLVFDDAWRYRDYVIEALNDDRGFDQFVKEQIAGDLMVADDRATRTRQLTATGFLALGPHNYELQDKELLRLEVVDEQISTIGSALMGLTIGCARCHDHKFDPIPTRDYYSLAGIFWNTNSLVPGNVSGFVQRKLPVEAARQQELERFAATREQYQQSVTELENKLRRARGSAPEGAIDPALLAGIVVDDRQAQKTGEWTDSQSVGPYVGSGYLHDGFSSQGQKSIEFRVSLEPGKYEVRLGYTASSNRASNTQVTVISRREEQLTVNQRRKPSIDGLFEPLLQVNVDTELIVRVSNRNANGHVIVDALQVVPSSKSEQLRGLKKSQTQSRNVELIRRLERQLSEARNRLKEFDKQAPATQPVVMSVEEQQEYEDFAICIRGNVHARGETVPSGFLTSIELDEPVTIPAGTSGRLQLAEWLTAPDHPLTSRVLANRVWQHLFGVGLVASVDNFGSMGSQPTHPELLDWLALELQQDNWSLKNCIRRIVLSRTYQLSSHASAELLAADPDNTLFARARRRRLDVECLRDAMLVCSQQIDRRMGGRTIPAGLRSELGFEYDGYRRSVYVPVFRNTLPDIFTAFDIADPNLVSGQRTASTRSTQALYFLNSPQVTDLASETAVSILNAHAGESIDFYIERAFWRVLSRAPTADEARVIAEYVSDELESGTAAELCWAAVVQGLFASVDFRYVD